MQKEFDLIVIISQYTWIQEATVTALHKTVRAHIPIYIHHRALSESFAMALSLDKGRN